MNSRIIGIIVRREYLNRVKKKSFLVTTFLVPVLFAAMCLLPSLIQSVIRAIDGHRLKYIDITISGIWEKEENTPKKEKKTL